MHLSKKLRFLYTLKIICRFFFSAFLILQDRLYVTTLYYPTSLFRWIINIHEIQKERMPTQIKLEQIFSSQEQGSGLPTDYKNRVSFFNKMLTSIDPSCINCNVRFTSVPWKVLSDQVWMIIIISLQTEATCAFLLQENIFELNTFKPRKTTMSSALFVVNRTFQSLHGGSLKILLTVPLMQKSKLSFEPSSRYLQSHFL